ncbi:uncharacterized protein si:ch211-126c2.4 isoform X2 [Trichomycterus rosablanca]|uniref:uncharacterized protein si:ch211-126c2.4 isoform X2 n=1 Tax=Trichomycterus rosablanca TaxID=2290929 RepID=UPI002F35D1E6
MESVQQEQAASSANRLRMSSSQPHLLPDLCFSSSVCKITDESLPYMSGIFDDTLNPSFMSNGPVATADIPDQLKPLPKNPEEQSISKAFNNSWLSIPVENGNQLDYSISFTMPQNNNEDAANVTETNLKEDFSGQPESTSCTEKCDPGVQSKNGTFNNSLKESSPGLNSTKPLLRESPESNKSVELQEKSARLSSIVYTENAGLEDKSEKHLNSTVDICGSANVTSEHPTTEKLDCTVDITHSTVPKQERSSEKLAADEKLDSTVDISQSSVVKQEQDKKRLSSTERLNEKLDCTVEINNLNVAKQEQDNNREQPDVKLECTVSIAQSDVPEQEPSLGLSCSKDSEKQCTFTKSTTETNSSGDLTADIDKNSSASSHVSTIVGQPSSVNLEKVDGTFTKHNATTDLAPVGPVPDTANTTMNITKKTNIDLPLESSPNNGLGPVKDPVLSEPSVPVSTAPTVSIEIAVCSNRTLDFPETESKAEEQQDVFRRRNGVSDNESCINLDISHSSMFSLDEMLDMKPPPLVASTPIILNRGFDRLGSIRPIDMQHRLSVINNVDKPLNNDAISIGTNDGSDASKTNPPSIRSETSSQIQKVSAKGTSNSTTESVVINKPPSKLAARRKIPQPSKSNIPKTQISLRPPISQLASVAGKSKIVTAAQTLNQPKMSSSALNSMRRTAHLNNGKNLASVKNTAPAFTPKTSSLAASGCNLTTDIKASNTYLAQPKPSGLQPPGRGRFGLKPTGTGVFPEDTGLSQTTNRQTGLSDMQNQPTCAEALSSTKLGGGAQKLIAAPTDIRPKGLNNDCQNCTLLQEKLQTFHQELGGFLQELGRIPADCGNWTSFQQKFEVCLEEFRRLQAAHQ